VKLFFCFYLSFDLNKKLSPEHEAHINGCSVGAMKIVSMVAQLGP